MSILRRLCLPGLLLNPLEAAAEKAAQNTGSPSGARLRVFLDCGDCCEAYLRDEITWVDFVRQPQDADVHVLSSDRETGGGGRELVLRFVGRGRFEGAATEPEPECSEEFMATSCEVAAARSRGSSHISPDPGVRQ